MPTVKLCRCGHPEDYHRTTEGGFWRCAGQSRINEAHPDYEDCGCRAFDPRPGDQGRML